MSDVVAIDTQLWEYACVSPRLPGGEALCQQARDFVDTLVADLSFEIAMTTYQLAEVAEVLRKVGADRQTRERVTDLLVARCRCVPVNLDAAEDSLALSLQSSIHVWDYLVVVPLRGLVDTIYSADTHSQHDHFRSIARVVNPLDWEMEEGQRPRSRDG
jgi:predicted nucleic acid-binding protein